MVLIITCKDDEVTIVFKNCNVATYSDALNVADAPFIDFRNVKLDFKNDTIVVKMDMEYIPSEIIFNNDALDINAANFFWEVAFDVNQNGKKDTGDLSFMISNYKINQGEVVDNILNITEKYIWEYGDHIRKPISNLNEVTITGNTVTIKVPLTKHEKLKGIKCDTDVYFLSGYFTGNNSYEDFSPG
jgi:hypothetical protein